MSFFLEILGKAVRASLVRSSCVFAVLMLCVTQAEIPAEAAEAMGAAFDRCRIEIVTQTAQGRDAAKGDLWYADAGEGAESLVEMAAADFFGAHGLDPADYDIIWQERSFEGLIETGDGLLAKQYRAKLIFRRKDTATVMPLGAAGEEEKEELHELSPRKAFYIAPFAMLFCLCAGYADRAAGKDAARLRSLVGIKNTPMKASLRIRLEAMKRRRKRKRENRKKGRRRRKERRAQDARPCRGERRRDEQKREKTAEGDLRRSKGCPHDAGRIRSRRL